jgi:MFS family permease
MNKKYKDLMYYKFCMYGFLKNQRYYSIFFILFLRNLGYTFLQIGILISIREVSVQLLEIPTGIVADVFGRRKSMLLSFAAYIISFLIFYLSNSFLLFSIAMIMFAFGETFRSGTHKAMIMQYLERKKLFDKKLEYYGGTRGCSQFGSAISSLIAAGLVLKIGNYRDVFLFTLIPYSMDFILMLTYPKYLESAKSNEKKSIKTFYTHIKSTFKNLVNTKGMIKLLINSSFSNANFSIIKEYLQPIIKAQAIAIPVLLWMNKFQRISILTGILYFGIYLFTAWASKNSSKLNKTIGKNNILKSIDILYLVNSLSIILIGLFFDLSLTYISIGLFFVIYFIQNGRRPMIVSYFGDKINKKERATVLSIDSMASSLIISIISILIGLMADKFGIGRAIFIYGIITIMATPFIKLQGENS